MIFPLVVGSNPKIELGRLRKAMTLFASQKASTIGTASWSGVSIDARIRRHGGCGVTVNIPTNPTHTLNSVFLTY